MRSSVKMTNDLSDLSDRMHYCNAWKLFCYVSNLRVLDSLKTWNCKIIKHTITHYICRVYHWKDALPRSFYREEMKIITAATWLHWPLLWDSTAAPRQTGLTWWRRWWWSLRRKRKIVELATLKTQLKQGEPDVIGKIIPTKDFWWL